MYLLAYWVAFLMLLWVLLVASIPDQVLWVLTRWLMWIERKEHELRQDEEE